MLTVTLRKAIFPFLIYTTYNEKQSTWCCIFYRFTIYVLFSYFSCKCILVSRLVILIFYTLDYVSAARMYILICALL